jgi:hypothetical protein
LGCSGRARKNGAVPGEAMGHVRAKLKALLLPDERALTPTLCR